MSKDTDIAMSVGPARDEAERDNLALIVSSNGTIEDILQGDDVSLSPATIDTIWPPNVAERIRRNIRKTLRSRQFLAEDVKRDDLSTNNEFIYVAQGRDRVLMIVRDASQQAGAVSRLQRLAYIDDATNLPNREYLLDELARVTDQQRLKEGRAAVICIHVDETESHRSAFGFGQRGVILRELGSRLKTELRAPNAEGVLDPERRSIVARIDYRQFAVVLPSIEGGEDAESVAQRLTARLQEPIYVNEKAVRIQSCAGIALFPQDGTEASTLCDNAYAAMQDAKSGHGNRVKFHSGTVNLRTLQRQDLELELKSALHREEFALNFLPIINTVNGRVESIEALLRWPKSLVGTQSTRKVISLAERTGLILPIGDWVLRTCCQQLRKWRDADLGDLRMAINMSIQEFSRPDLAQRIAGALSSAGLLPGDIEVEITEHMLSRDAVAGYEVCNALKSLDLTVVLDDYGTGSCSLTELSESRIDGLKIDNTLIAQLGQDTRSSAACAAAISLARALDLTVIAEGVETEEQQAALTKLGVDKLQGFHFCRPLDADDVPAFVGARNA